MCFIFFPYKIVQYTIKKPWTFILNQTIIYNESYFQQRKAAFLCSSIQTDNKRISHQHSNCCWEYQNGIPALLSIYSHFWQEWSSDKTEKDQEEDWFWCDFWVTTKDLFSSPNPAGKKSNAIQFAILWSARYCSTSRRRLDAHIAFSQPQKAQQQKPLKHEIRLSGHSRLDGDF